MKLHQLQAVDTAAPKHPPTNRQQRRAIRSKQVLERVPFSRSHLYLLIAQGKFPKPFKLVDGGHASAFWEDEVDAWLAAREAA